MNNTDLEFNLSELKARCTFFKISIKGMNRLLSVVDNPEGDDLFWYYAQNGISNIADISKLLWGSKNNADSQHQQLRKLLRVKNNSYIKSKSLNDNLEHIDEHLNAIAKRSHGMMIDKSAWIVIDEEVPENENILRLYNPETTDFTFMDFTFNFHAALIEVSRLESNIGTIIELLPAGETYESLTMLT